MSTSAPPPVSSDDVIDWDEAMEQCGDDEEFLRELLGDLRSETDAQMSKMEEIIKNPTDDAFVQIMRASHVIKGAASNLMCLQLRTAAMQLEQAASNASTNANNPEAISQVQIRHNELKQAVTNYQAFLTSIGV